MDLLTKRFLAWKRSVIGMQKRELKGSELDSAQLHTFVCQVLPPAERLPLLTICCADTAKTQESHVAAAKEQLSQQYSQVARLLREGSPPNNSLAQDYAEISGWTKKRSAVNFLWIVTAERTVAESIGLMLRAFVGPEYDREFENVEISIDRSFIKEPGPIQFWLEYVRLAFLNRAKRSKPFVVPKEWGLRRHPYYRKYRKDGVVDFSDLLRHHMSFVDSKRSIGIQVVDICAQICRRYHRGETDLEAYVVLESRIDGCIGLHFDQTSIFQDKPENHVALRTTEEQKRQIRTVSSPHRN
jgi:hypothetical protein